jgi:PAS domain S-box-containing protein
VGRDVTDRKRAEDALRESEERFRTAFEHAPVGMWLVAPDGRWLRVNAALCEMVGRTEREMLATTFQAITHPDDLAGDLTLLEQLRVGDIPS